VLPPPPDFVRAPLVTAEVPAGARYKRIYRTIFPDPLGCGKGPSRFSDPRPLPPEERFGLVYMGASTKVCFLEALLRDRRDGRVGPVLLDEEDFRSRSIADIAVRIPLTLLDLTGDGPVRMGVPSEVVRGTDQRLARQWAVAFFEHPLGVDGILYPSRLNTEMNVALFETARQKLAVVSVSPLVLDADLPGILRHFDVAIASVPRSL